MEKQKTTVRVAGKDYALVSTDSPEHLNRVAAYVDRQMTETMRSGRIPANTAAVLTALNLADDLMRAQEQLEALLAPDDHAADADFADEDEESEDDDE